MFEVGRCGDWDCGEGVVGCVGVVGAVYVDDGGVGEDGGSEGAGDGVRVA